MDEGPRFFTVEEANALVGTLALEFGRLTEVRAELGPVIEALGGPEVAIGLLRDGDAPPPGREAAARQLERLAGIIAGTIEHVNALGCLVKDVDQGLVDFYALRDGEPVFLCWQFGEPAVSHWHGVDEGFGGRRPLEGFQPPAPAFPN